jgi:arsenate reductase
MSAPGEKTILFLCTGNSCRSQMAEGFGLALAPTGYRILSAGTDPKGIHPRAVQAMDEVGVDIRSQTSNDLEGIELADLDLIVTLCGSADEQCPVLPTGVEKEHWPLPDPAEATGSEEEVAAIFRSVRDDIHRRVEELLARNDT